MVEVFDQEFADHPKQLWSINDKYYDLSQFSKVHPGGEDFVSSCRGTDATELFESHHLNQSKVTALLAKYELPLKGNEELYKQMKVRGPTKATFKKNGYYDRVRTRVLALYPEMSQRRQTKRYTTMLYLFIALAVVSEALLLMYTPSWSFHYIAIIFTVVTTHTVLGGYGHNFCHVAGSSGGGFLDWNGLSGAEWMLEHIQSHHMHTNSDMDHDRHSMKPFVVWTPECGRSLFSSIFSSTLIILIFFIGELIVTINGNLVHLFRHKYILSYPGAFIAPWLTPLRLVVPFIAHGLYGGLISSIGVSIMSSVYFTCLAHCTHMSSSALDAGQLNYVEPKSMSTMYAENTNNGDNSTPSNSSGIDWGLTQLATSKDIEPVFESFFTGVLGLGAEWSHCLSSAILLGLDRQSMHHLFPPIDHSCMDKRVRLIALEELEKERQRVPASDKKMSKLLDECAESLKPIPLFTLLGNQISVAHAWVLHGDKPADLERNKNRRKSMYSAYKAVTGNI